TRRHGVATCPREPASASARCRRLDRGRATAILAAVQWPAVPSRKHAAAGPGLCGTLAAADSPGAPGGSLPLYSRGFPLAAALPARPGSLVGSGSRQCAAACREPPPTIGGSLSADGHAGRAALP